MAEVNSSISSSLSLAGMKETEGDRIIRAIQKLAEKIQALESERKYCRRKVERMGTQELSTVRAGEFFQRLAKAEARCKALQQQLSHIRKLVRRSFSLPDDVNTQQSNFDIQMPYQTADYSTSFDSLSSLASISVRGSTDSKLLDKGLVLEKFPSVSKTEAAGTSNVLPTASPSGILDIPVSQYFHRANSAGSNKSDISSNDILQTRAKTRAKEIARSGRQSSVSTQNSDQAEKEIASPTLTSNTQHQAFTENLLPHTGKPEMIKEERYPLGTTSNILPSKGKDVQASHYHVKMNKIPFCSVTSSGKSHSLGANLQNLMSMVKVCHPALCSAAPLHRRRSRSADGQSDLRSHRQDTVRRKLTRWNSASTLEGSQCRRARRNSVSATEGLQCRPARSRIRTHSVGDSSGRRSNALDDLDLVPVKLKSSKDNLSICSHKVSCETPGNVCIKSEVWPVPNGSNKVVEVKMTTRSKSTCDRSRKLDSVMKRRQLLKNVQELQHMVQADDWC